MKGKKWRSMQGKIVLFFLLFTAILVAINTFLYIKITHQNLHNSLIHKIYETKESLALFNNTSKNILPSEIDYRTNVENQFKDLKQHFKDFFLLNDARDIVIEEHKKSSGDIDDSQELIEQNDSEDDKVIRSLVVEWIDFKKNAVLFFEEPTYIDSIYKELIKTDSVGIDPESGEVIRNYLQERSKKVINPLLRDVVIYNGIQVEQIQSNLSLILASKINNKQELSQIVFVLWVLNIAIIFIYALSGFFIIKSTVLLPVYELSRNSELALKGDLSEKTVKSSQEEINSIMNCINIFSHYIENATNFVRDVSANNLKSQVQFMDMNDSGQKNDLAIALVEMRDKMIEVNRIEKERNWEVEGLAQFADLLQKNSDNFQKLTETTISRLVKYLSANQGGVFIVNKEDTENQYLELVASFAYDRKKFISKKLELGEGLAGQCWQERGTIFIKDLPENHMVIKSGLGDAGPTSLLIVPLIDNDEIYGVVELASFNEIQQYQIDFVEKVSSSIASALSASEMTRKTQTLLQNSQELTERLMSQEENMRQNLEEMQVIQERQEHELKQSKIQYEQKIRNLSTEIEKYKLEQSKLNDTISKLSNNNPSKTIQELQSKIEEYNKNIADLENLIKIKDMKINKLSGGAS